MVTVVTAISQNLGSAHFFKFFLRGSQERKDLALNPKRVSLVVGKDQQRTCAVMGRKCRVKPAHQDKPFIGRRVLTDGSASAFPFLGPLAKKS